MTTEELLAELQNNPTIKAVLDVLSPLLPALIQMAKDEFERVIRSIIDEDWPTVYAASFPLLTREQRLRVMDEDYKAMVADVSQMFRDMDAVRGAVIGMGLSLLLSAASVL